MDKAFESLLSKLQVYESLWWENPRYGVGAPKTPFSLEDVEDAEKRLKRFASYIAKVFPETASEGGLIESSLRPLQRIFTSSRGIPFLKEDHALPISGSIKARGGIYEILKLAEGIALREGGLKEGDDYTCLGEEGFQRLFSKYTVLVGSTGNLGLSIGIISKKLGFQVAVHMSREAREWKKEKLRSLGVQVVEHPGDYSTAITEARERARKQDKTHFVDDENSKDLFLGYAVAALRTTRQIQALGYGDRKIYLYLPCGVGGGPGGVAYGFRLLLGDQVEYYFAEPTHAPCMLLGLATGKHDAVRVQDYGLDCRTALDGLAVGRPSRLVGKIIENTVKGLYTVEDADMLRWQRRVYQEEGLYLEPSALGGFRGFEMNGDKEGVHILWATGGSMVPQEVRRRELGDLA